MCILQPGERGDGHGKARTIPLTEEAVRTFTGHVEENRKVWIVDVFGFILLLLSLMGLHDSDD